MDNNIQELIKITEREDGRRAVSARELHEFLESKRDFSNWFKYRIEKYGLVENIDYQILRYDYQGNLLNPRVAKNGESDNQRVSKIEYALSIDAAKELSMVEGNEKGKEARRYFIACEKIAHEKILTSSTELLLQSTQLIYKLEQKVNADRSKVDWAEKNQESKGLHTVTACVQDERICADFMNKTLKHYKIQRNVGGEWALTTKWQNRGFAEANPVYFPGKGDNEGRTTLQLKWFEKGRRLMQQLIKHALKDGFLQIKKNTGRYTINTKGNYSYTNFKFID